jgi:hypothetical protein
VIINGRVSVLSLSLCSTYCDHWVNLNWI